MRGGEATYQRHEFAVHRCPVVEHARPKAVLAECKQRPTLGAVAPRPKLHHERKSQGPLLRATGKILRAHMQLEQQRIEFEKWKAELAANTQIYLEQLKLGSTQTPQQENPDINNALAASIDGFRMALDNMNRPKSIIRGADGRAEGIQ